MRSYTLVCEMIAKRPLEQVFSVFEDPHNLARITPPWLSFRVRTKDRIEMKRGAEIEYSIKWLGLPLKWKTRITDYEPMRRFVDEQARGPYVFWRHVHTFAQTPEGVTVEDRVEYALPFGALGSVAHAALVARQLRETFNYRQRKLRELFGGQTIITLLPTIG